MKIRIIWTGKTKEKFIADGIQKYLKFLKQYADVRIMEIKEEKGSDIQRIREKESERILKLAIPYVLLDEKGKQLTSTEFSGFLKTSGSALNMVIGGAYGVSDSVRKSAHACISLSSMTFTHELARLILLEQTYRAFTIIHGKGYHH